MYHTPQICKGSHRRPLVRHCLSLTPATRLNIFKWGDIRLLEAAKKAPPTLKSCLIGLSRITKALPTDPSSGDNSWACQPLFENSNITPPTTGHGPTGGQRLPLLPKNYGLPADTNLKVIDLYMGDGKKVTRESLQDKLQNQFPGIQIVENTHLRLTWLCPYLCGHGSKYNGQKRVFPNTAPLLNRNPPLYSHPSMTSLISKIKKGSKTFLKCLNRSTDFLTTSHLESCWRTPPSPKTTLDGHIKWLKAIFSMGSKKT